MNSVKMNPQQAPALVDFCKFFVNFYILWLIMSFLKLGFLNINQGYVFALYLKCRGCNCAFSLCYLIFRLLNTYPTFLVILFTTHPQFSASDI